MRVLVVSDLHGRTCWQEPVTAFLEANPDGLVVFLGDYNDSFNVSDRDMLQNFRAVIQCKLLYGDQVVLLLGNHCFPYLYHTGSALDYRCSGFRPSLVAELHLLYKEHEQLFKVAHQLPTDGFTYLFVHAGVTRFWLDHNETLLQSVANLTEAQKLADLLNACLTMQKSRDALWQVSARSGGYSPVDGLVWVRPQELSKGVLANYVQVVGHTQVKGITRALNETGTTGVILTDCLHDGQKADKNEFLILTI